MDVPLPVLQWMMMDDGSYFFVGVGAELVG